MSYTNICWILCLCLVTSSALAEKNAVANIKIQNGKIAFQTTHPEVCHYGDWDIMSEAVAKQGLNTKDLILTLEPLAEKPEFPALSYILAKNGGSLNPMEGDLQLPKLNSSVLAGFFICTDEKKRKSCARLPRRSFQELEEEYTSSGDDFDEDGEPKGLASSSPDVHDDNIFFFQPVILDGTSLTIVTDTENLRQKLAGLGSFSTISLEKSASLHKALSSYPLSVEDKNLLTINLPRFSKEADTSPCEEE